MRRSIPAALLLLLALALAGCAGPVPGLAPAPPHGAGDRVVVATGTGLAVLDADAGRVAFNAAYGVPTPDWSHLVAVAPGDGDGRLAVLDAQTGAPGLSLDLPSGLVPTVVSTSGRRVALSEPRRAATTDGSAWLPAPRERTRIVVVDATTGGDAPRVLDLPGNLEPEAFSADDQRLMVIDYLPPLAPDRYRVRQVDLRTGEVRPLVDRFKRVPLAVDETMRGTGRMQVLSPDARVLYTLYTHQPDHLHARDLAAGLIQPRGDVHAFVHVLNLVEGWAYCLDLPLPFGSGPASAHAIAVAPDGGRLYVVDRSSGTHAAIDTRTLKVLSSVTDAPDPHAERGGAAAQVSPDGARVYVAGGSELLALGASNLTVEQRWPVAGVMRGLGISPDGRRLYLALDGRLAVLDTTTGRQLGSIEAPDVRSVKHVEQAAAQARGG